MSDENSIFPNLLDTRALDRLVRKISDLSSPIVIVGSILSNMKTQEELNKNVETITEAYKNLLGILNKINADSFVIKNP